MSPASPREVMAELQRQIRQIETQDRPDRSVTISSGVPAIDAVLPGGGYARGSLVEWLSDGGIAVGFSRCWRRDLHALRAAR